jgi:hypothetical protein
VLLLSGAFACSTAIAAVAAPAPAKVPQLIFPVVGKTTYSDDFGDARGSGRHEGNDLLAPRRALAVAAEAGTVSFYAGSARAGCMLTLKGESGTHYAYIHLNNDVTQKNDNRGKCVAGVAYAKGLKTGARVGAGEPVGYVGNSGDADATSPHLHFEVHPNGGRAVNPFPHLQKARKLLFAAKLGTFVTLKLRGTTLAGSKGTLRMRVQTLRRWPGGLQVQPARVVDLALPSFAVVVGANGSLVTPAKLAAGKPGQPVAVTTELAPATLEATLGAPLALTARAVVVEP